MRIYANCLEMHNEVKRDLHEMGTLVHPQTMQDKDVADDPNFETLELSPYDFMIVDGSDRVQLLEKLGLDVQWFHDEFDERVSGMQENPGEAWKLRRATWEEFIHDGTFAYTYSERMGRKIHRVDDFAGTSALDVVIGELRERPDTRQAILPIFYGNDDLANAGGFARIPCSMHYQFTIRQNELRIFYIMRSSDFATHFAYDIALALELQAYVADVLRLKAGRMSFFTGSLHLYRKDWDGRTF